MHYLKSICLIVVCTFLSICTKAQEVLEWRGTDRTGVYNETGLLKTWPAEGPAMIWESENIGNGYGSPAITKTNIYVNGEIDSVTYLFCLDLKGKIQWKSKIGEEWIQTYPGARTTPTVVNDLVYVTAGMGAITCFDAKTGKEKWAVDMVKDFRAPIPRFGFSESVLIEGDNVYCTPGNHDTSVVALNRFTGKVNWICAGPDSMTTYCSPMLIKLPKRTILVTFTKSNLLGIDIKTGKLLWSHKQDGQGDVHVNTPLYENGFIYYVTGDGNGGVKLKLSDDGTSVTEVWRNKAYDNCFGAFIKNGNYLFSSGYEKRYYFTLDANNGNIVDSMKFYSGSLIMAENLLYLYNEKGQVGLFKANGPKLEMISQFKITKGTKAHYAHPVICNKILYIRRGTSLMAYDIKNNS